MMPLSLILLVWPIFLVLTKFSFYFIFQCPTVVSLLSQIQPFVQNEVTNQSGSGLELVLVQCVIIIKIAVNQKKKNRRSIFGGSILQNSPCFYFVDTTVKLHCNGFEGTSHFHPLLPKSAIVRAGSPYCGA